MIYFDDIPKVKLAIFKDQLTQGERPSIAIRQLYDSMGIDNPDQVGLSTIVDLLEWAIPQLDINAVSGRVIDSGCPFFSNERDSVAFDALINEWTVK